MGMFDKKEIHRDVEKVIHIRYRYYIAIISILFVIFIIKMFNIQVTNNQKHLDDLEKYYSKITYSAQPPRGVIYDRNYNVVVGNQPVYTIKYKKPSGYSQYDDREYEMALDIAKLIEMPISRLQTRDIKDVFIRRYEKEAFAKLTTEELTGLLTLSERHELIRARLTEEDLSVFTEEELEAVAIFTEMNRGYRSQMKVIKNVDVSETEYSLLSENEKNFPGISTNIDWVRYYPYDDIFRGILGRVTTSNQGLPLKYKDLYSTLGYDLDSRVGSIDSLEAEFEMFLNSVESKTLSNDSGLYEVLTEAKKGNDIVLTLDFELTKRLSDAIDSILLDASKYPNSKYMDRAFVMISNPKTGEILSMVSRIMYTDSDNHKQFIDYSAGLTTYGVLAGSTVKPAFLASAMDAGVIFPGEKKLDECIKIAATPQKCSWRNGLGVLSDIDALYQSSNSYMFKTVIEWAGGNYIENQPLRIDLNTFNELRKYYKEFGLGMHTNIDLPREDLGYKNLSGSLPGFLMDLSIGQYDSYTVAQLSQYINTLANGRYKMKPRILKEVYTASNEFPLTEQIYDFTPTIESEINIDDKYIDRVRSAMNISASPKNQLLNKLITYIPDASAKTGTAEGFYDTDGDGLINTDYVFISESFMAFAPFDNPDMAMIIVIPNVRYLDGDEYKYPARETITKEVTKIYYEMY